MAKKKGTNAPAKRSKVQAPRISNGQTPLVWFKDPNGGRYAGYKFGDITYYKGFYYVKLPNPNFGAKVSTLKEARAIIDKYTTDRLKKEGKLPNRKITKK